MHRAEAIVLTHDRPGGPHRPHRAPHEQLFPRPSYARMTLRASMSNWFSSSLAAAGNERETLREISTAGNRPRSAIFRSSTTCPSRIPRIISATGLIHIGSLNEDGKYRGDISFTLLTGPGPLNKRGDCTKSRRRETREETAVPQRKPQPSRCDSAKRVRESKTSSTFLHWSRKYSAIAIAR